MKSLFISVHFDDAVFSCGKLMADMQDITCLTVFGGMPTNKFVCTAYDQKSNFENAEQALIGRRSEDAAALTVLGCDQRWLDIPESQYGEERNLAELEKEIEEHVKEFDEIYIPLGAIHPDHEIVGNIMRNIARKSKDKIFYTYMDMPYYVDNPEVMVDKLREVKKLKYEYRGGDLGKKMLAIACYKSQVPIVNLYHLICNERYYVKS